MSWAGGVVSHLQVDAFTSRPFSGNPAGVVPDASGLDEAQMQAIARELALAGTGFVVPTAVADADLGLRYFTPAREVAYSGHTTVATVHALAEAGRVPGERLVLDTRKGLLPVAVERRGDHSVVWLEPPVSACRPFAGSLEPIGAALGLPVPQIGRLSLEVDVSGGSVTRVRVGGTAVTVLRGVIRVP